MLKSVHFFILMMIQTKKNLVILDLETTGLDVTTDRIVEIALLKVQPDGTQEEYLKRLNPTIPISKESAEIHGITDEMIKDAPTFEEEADAIADFIDDADLIGYNSNKFDIPLLAEEFLRVNHAFKIADRQFIDVQNIFHKMEQRTLVAAYKFYCQKDLIDAHSAMADVKATYEVLLAQINRYKEELKNDIEFLSSFSKAGKNQLLDFAGRIALNKNGKAIYNFGKHKGKTIAEVNDSEPGYYGWMLNSNFPLYTKEVLKKEMEKIKSQQPKNIKKENPEDPKQMQPKLDALKNKFEKSK